MSDVWVTNDSFTAANGTLLLDHVSDTGDTWVRVIGWGIDDDGECVIHSNKVRRPTYAEDPTGSGSETMMYPSNALLGASGGLVVEADLQLLNPDSGAAFALYKNCDAELGPNNYDLLCWIGANGQPCLGYTDPSVGSVITDAHTVRYQTDFTTAWVYLDGALLFSEAWAQPPIGTDGGRGGTTLGQIGFDLFDSADTASLAVDALRIGHPGTLPNFWTDFDLTREILPGGLLALAEAPALPLLDPMVFFPKVQPPKPRPQSPEPQPAPRSSIVLSDTFTGTGDITAHPSDSGHAWTYSDHLFFDGFSPRNANIILASGVALLDTASYNRYASVVSNAAIGSPDGYLEAHIVGTDMHFAHLGFGLRYTEATGAGIFVGLNGADASHQYFYVQAWRGGADPGISIVDGADGSSPGLPVANPNDYLLRIEYQGDVLRLYANGVLGYTTDASYVSAAGTVGFWLNTDVPTKGTVSSIEAGPLGGTSSGFWTDFDLTREILPGGLVVAASEPPKSPVYEPPAPLPRTTVFVAKSQLPEPAPRIITDFLLDNFTGSTGPVTSHTSDSGHTWAVSHNIFFAGFYPPSAVCNVSGGLAVMASAGGYSGFVSNVVPPSADYSVEARCKGVFTSAQDAGIAGRYNESNGAGYFIETFPVDATRIAALLEYWDGGANSATLIDRGSDHVVANPNDYILRLDMTGSQISMFVNNALIGTVTDTHVTAPGTVGFWLAPNGTATNMTLDYINGSAVTPPASGSFWTDFDLTQETLSP